jgi:hypothetical protein
MEEIIEEVEKGEMPLRTYIYTHPNAEMDDAKIKILKAWLGSESEMQNGEKPKLRYQNDN